MVCHRRQPAARRGAGCAWPAPRARHEGASDLRVRARTPGAAAGGLPLPSERVPATCGERARRSVVCTGSVQLACATGRTGQVECHCSKLHSVCCTWRTHVGVPMQSIADQELDWATVALEVSVECRSVSCSEARGMAGTGRQNCIFSGRAVRLNSLTSRKKKGSKSKYLLAKSDTE